MGTSKCALLAKPVHIALYLPGELVPRHPFFVMDGERARPQAPSHWMYPTQAPARGDAGRKPTIPGSAQLPSSASEEAKVDQSKGKGKGREPAAADKEDSSLGESSDSDDDGMDVDVSANVEAAPTNVVVVEGLSDEVSALMFRTTAADLLFGANARPLAIIRGRGLMWIRFATTTEGRRAYGSLPNLNFGLRASFRADAEFDEAYQYTRDIWTTETFPDVEMEVENAPPPPYAPPTSPPPPAAASAPVLADRVEVEDRPAEDTPLLDVGGDAAFPNAQGEEAVTPALDADQEPITLPTALEPPPTTDPSARHSAQINRPLPPTRVPPTEPRAMRVGSPARGGLAERLTSPPPQPFPRAVAVRPLADRLTSAPVSTPRPLAERLSPTSRPLVQRLSGPPLEERLSWPTPAESLLERIEMPRRSPSPLIPSPFKRAKPAEDEPSEENLETSPAKKKVRRGRRSGRAVKELERIWAERRAAESSGGSLAEAGPSTGPGTTAEDDLAPPGLPVVFDFAPDTEGWQVSRTWGSAAESAASQHTDSVPRSQPVEVPDAAAWLAGEDAVDYEMEDGEVGEASGMASWRTEEDDDIAPR